MNFEWEKGFIWWLNPLGVFLIVGFIWNIVYQICEKFMSFSQGTLHGFENSEFIISGACALITIYLTRKEKMVSIAGKLSLIFSALLYSCFVYLGLRNYL